MTQQMELTKQGFEYEYIKVQDAQFISFYQIPQALFFDEFKNLSDSARIVYGLMLDRTKLSQKNKWVDEIGNVFIYFTYQELSEMLGYGKEKTAKIMKELEKVNLIERQRQGLKKPNKIYVKNLTKRYKSAQ